jgi:Domain of unknown function (DUF4352)/Protein of unknown function (DUF2510)
MTTPLTPAGWYPDGSGGQRYWDGIAWTEHRVPATPPSAVSGNRKLITGYAAACAALLAVLLLVVVYAAFFTNDTVDIDASGPGTTMAEATGSPTTGAQTVDAIDDPLSFTVRGVEVGTTVVSSDAPIDKTAAGEYIIVHMTVTNTGVEPATFLGTFQKLIAGGTTYNIDDEATFYVGGGLAELPPGSSADVSVAFDVPPGTEAEAIELHADPMSPGVEVSLS